MDRTSEKQLQTLLMTIVAFNILPHAFSVPPWITALSFLFLVWKALAIYRGLPLPGRWLSSALAVIALGGVFLEFKTVIGQDPASALLVLLATLKLLETNRYRDAMLMIFISYFLLMAHLLASQSLPSTVFMAADVLLITALMFHIHKIDRRHSVRSFRPILRILSLAIPVWIFLFLVFPRFSAGLWNFKTKATAGTGFSDSMNPGTVASLVDNPDPAFRVRFLDGTAPSPESLYWRGAVLSLSEGLRWYRVPETYLSGAKPPPLRNLRTITQEIVIEPGAQRWLFALDWPLTVEFNDILPGRKILERTGQIFESEQDLLSQTLYTAVSAETTEPGELNSSLRAKYLQVPSDFSPELQALVTQLSIDTKTTSDRVNRVLEYFTKNKFVYTKEPGRLTTGRLEEFLFQSKQGFCEHYAGAFATLLRLMNVPTRVVVGFQGGTYNEFGGFLVVRNLDAHAWNEVFNDESKKWERVDPTTWIAPDRLRLGGDFNQLSPDQLGLSTEEIRKGAYHPWMRRLYYRSAQVWEAMAMSWTGFLLRYDFDYQMELLKRMGIGETRRLVFFIWLAVGTLIFLSALYLFYRKRASREDRLLRIYRDYCRHFEKQNVSRRLNEGPLEFAQRVRKKYPEITPQLNSFVQHYVDVRYGTTSPASPAKVRALKTELRDLKRVRLKVETPSQSQTS